MAFCNNGISRASATAKNGEPSSLYAALLDKFKDRDVAVSLYAYAHTDEFKSKFGDWENNPENLNLS